jgi:hypothetical protein
MNGSPFLARGGGEYARIAAIDLPLIVGRLSYIGTRV